MKLYLTSPVPVSANHYLSYRVIKRNGKYTAMSYRTAKAEEYAKQFADYVTKEVERQDWQRPADTARHIYVDGYFYFDRIDKDCANYWKLMLDAITDTGLIWNDDNIVCERVQRIYYDSSNPRIELIIYPVDYIGIFDNELHLEKFKQKCFGCTRYKNNCSILRKAVSGRIQEEVRGETCTKYKEKKEKNDDDNQTDLH